MVRLMQALSALAVVALAVITAVPQVMHFG